MQAYSGTMHDGPISPTKLHKLTLTLLAIVLSALPLHTPVRIAAAAGRITSTHRVCASGCPFTTIQAAIAAAADNDAIEVAAGTYNEVLTIDKSLDIRGGYVTTPAWGPGPANSRSSVRGDGARSVIRMLSPDAETRTVTLTRVVIENGQAQTGGGVDARAVNLVISDSVFVRNTVTPTAEVKDVFGAGVFVEGGTLHVDGSRFEANGNCPVFGCRIASGGGIYLSATLSASIASSIFVSNSAWAGAGIAAKDVSLRVVSSTFQSPIYPARYGFGVHATGGSDVHVSGNRFAQLRSGADGGAVHLTQVQAITFTSNHVSDVVGEGPPVLFDARRALVSNNVWSANENNFTPRGIITLDVHQLMFAHNTLSGNRVVSAAVPMLSVFGRDSVVIANNVLADAPLGVRWSGDAPMTMTHNLMYRVGVPFEGAAPTLSDTLLTADPRFVLPPNDLRIAADSPARDAGAALPEVMTDFDGRARDAAPDIGAHEFDPSAPTPDVGARKLFLPSVAKR